MQDPKGAGGLSGLQDDARFLLVENLHQLVDEHGFRYCAFDMDGLVDDSARHAVHLILVCQVRKLGCFDHVGCYPFAFHCHAMGEHHGSRAIRSGGGDVHLDVDGLVNPG